MNKDFLFYIQFGELNESLCLSQYDSLKFIYPQANNDDNLQKCQNPLRSEALVIKNIQYQVKLSNKSINKKIRLTQIQREIYEDDDDEYQQRKKANIDRNKQFDIIYFNSHDNLVQTNFKILEYIVRTQCDQFEIKQLSQLKTREGFRFIRDQYQIPAIQYMSFQKLEPELEYIQNDYFEDKEISQFQIQRSLYLSNNQQKDILFRNRFNKLQQILLNFNIPKIILEVLDEQNHQHLFFQDLQEITKELKVVLLKVHKIDIDQSNIQFQIVGEQLNKKNINRRIKELIIDQLLENFVDLSIELLLKYNKLEFKHQFEQKYNCYLKIFNQQQRFQYVTLNKYRLQIEQAIHMILKQTDIKVQVDQNLIFNKLMAEIQKSKDQFDAVIEFHSKFNIIQLHGSQYNVDKVLSAINEIKQNIQNQLQVLTVNVHERQWQILQTKQKEQFKQIMDRYDTFYVYSDILNHGKQKSQIIANLRFQNKHISIHYGRFMNKSLFISEEFNQTNSHIFRTNQDFQELNKKILKIFQQAEQENSKFLMLPILTAEQSSPLFQTSCRNFLETIITLTKISKIVDKQQKQILKKLIFYYFNQKTFCILEIIMKINKYCFSRFIRQQEQQQQVKQEDKEKQEQLEEQEEYEVSEEQDIIQEFSQYPPTHKINLQSMMMTDLQLNIKQQITFNSQQNGAMYNINGRPVSENLGLYIEQQISNKIFIFDIFLDQHKPILKNFNFKIEQSSYQLQEKMVSIDIKSFDSKNLEQVKQEIDNLINDSIVFFKWKVLNFKIEDLIEIEDFIIKNSIGFKGQINAGNEIKIKCFQKKLIKIQKYLINLLREKIIFPENWVVQYKNFVKIQLRPDDQEFKQVQEKFQKGYRQGIIYQINRIQNKWLYENFINEQYRLLRIKQNQRQTLTKIELNRSLWHGVKYTHPSIIYESENEAFKCNYSRVNNSNGLAQGSWGGPATYFAEKSKYSKSYAYQLKPSDSLQFQGKFVFLLCQVTTGICANCSANQALREPPQGFDCVVGTSHNSEIFVLYGMDSRRAYPLYEIIFE